MSVRATGETIFATSSMIFVAIIACWPQEYWYILVWLTAGLLPWTLLRRLPLSSLLLRLLPVWFLVGLIGLGALLTEGKAIRPAVMLLKASLCVWILVLTTSTLGQEGLLNVLRAWPLPAVLKELLGFWFRYGELALSEWKRIDTAVKARSFSTKQEHKLQTRIWSVGWLFLRCYQRGERVYRAMQARCYPSGLH